MRLQMLFPARWARQAREDSGKIRRSRTSRDQLRLLRMSTYLDTLTVRSELRESVRLGTAMSVASIVATLPLTAPRKLLSKPSDAPNVEGSKPTCLAQTPSDEQSSITMQHDQGLRSRDQVFDLQPSSIKARNHLHGQESTSQVCRVRLRFHLRRKHSPLAS